MKKLFAILLAVMMVASMATVASAANTTTLTTTVPAATYTLNIPADQEIAFGATRTTIGNVTVTDASSFAVGKNVEVEVTYDAFKSDDVATTIPFKIEPSLNTGIEWNIFSGRKLTFRGEQAGTVTETAQIPVNYAGNNEDYVEYVDIYGLIVVIDSIDWGKALAGEYTATITFTAEVVAE